MVGHYGDLRTIQGTPYLIPDELNKLSPEYGGLKIEIEN